MGLKIQAVQNYSTYTDMKTERSEVSAEENESIFVTADEEEQITEETTDPEEANPVDPPKGKKTDKNESTDESEETVEEEPAEESVDDESADEEPSEYDPTKDKWGDEGVKEKKHKKVKFGAPFRLRKCDGKVYMGELTLRPAAYVGYDIEKGLSAGGLYGVRYKDVAGIENLTTNAAVYMDYSRQNISSDGKRSAVATGLQASVEYQGACDSPKMFGYVGASAKLGYQNTDTNWTYETRVPDSSKTSLKTNTQQASGELLVHGGVKFENTARKSKTSYYVKAGVFGGLDSNYFSSNTKNADATNTQPVELSEVIYKPKYNSARPMGGTELEVGFETKNGFGGSVSFYSAALHDRNYLRDHFYNQSEPNEAMQNDRADRSNKCSNIKIGAKLTFNIGGKKR